MSLRLIKIDYLSNLNFFSCSGKRKRGRPSIHSKYPELVPCVENFIEQNSAEAHLRRRTSSIYTNGVTLNNISTHVKNQLNLDVDENTIARLMEPPRKKTRSSKYYKSLIKARVPPKRNSKERREHNHFHYTSSQVKLVNGLAYLCKDNTLMMVLVFKNVTRILNIFLTLMYLNLSKNEIKFWLSFFVVFPD